MAKQLTSLDTVDAVIAALGGVEAVQRLTKRQADSAVPMWKHREKFPPYTYKILQSALLERHLTAPDHLWGML
jgi:hypothetical protein